jgi:hypothetical protein
MIYMRRWSDFSTVPYEMQAYAMKDQNTWKYKLEDICYLSTSE